ncbi:TolC family protein [Bordetella parapertussis]|nr:TolC family protein [Bordetella parapertussis]UEB19042.1 TolC family protein [Bordetella parapertussis]
MSTWRASARNWPACRPSCRAGWSSRPRPATAWACCSARGPANWATSWPRPKATARRGRCPTTRWGCRPNWRAAEARLHQATARIGLAQADLYPSIRLGARFGYESYESGKFGDWGSRTWSIGPSLDLPIFDSGRRRSVVTLRELQQQEAAVAYQQTVLRAWHEVDDALSGYRAEQLQYARLREKAESAAQARAWAQARYLGGLTDYLAVLDAQREDLQARRDLTASDGRLRTRLVVLYKALAGGAETQP